MLHQIGAGALGPVFRAYEPGRDRLVAIKLFRLDLPPERVHQLVAEFEQLIAAGLDHPVIAAPLAAGIDGVTAYLAQEYVTADSLDIVMREGWPSSAADALGVASRLAEALDYAADRRVAHGALHPRDVLLSPEDFRVVGLGVTRALERVGVTAPVRRPYTAPERIDGGAWDRRADVFSLAAVIHERIWGRRIAGTGTQAASAIEDAAGGSLPALRDVFACALADDMADRFATATEFADALTGAFEHRPAKVSRMLRRKAEPSAAEPMLPLHADEPNDLALHAPEPPLDQDLEDEDSVQNAAPMVAPVELDHAPVEPLEPPILSEPPQPQAGHSEPFVAGSLLSPPPAESSSLSLVWPLALAGIVGMALGFGAGYAVAIRDRSIDVEGATARVAGTASALPVPELPASAVEPPRPAAPSADAPVAAPPPAATARPAAAPLFAGRVVVRSTPPGARVFVDGHSGGETPTTVRELSRGAHQVRLVHEGYTTIERRIVVTAAQPSLTLTVPMVRTPPPQPAAPVRTEVPLVVESKPAGAAVFLDGRPVGTTPLTFPLVQVGAHSVRLVLDGYRPWSSPVQVSATEPNRVTASLER